ncbi:E3 ubiquitin-protein ligase RING1-like [Cardamine amara subsp. amara]|uniref:RING-type E3 ubiquitin transferase n=1 Tax=Cardamine amara subsp. amara TaxID=228776 RepID=A0ABD1BVE4_CARAN
MPSNVLNRSHLQLHVVLDARKLRRSKRNTKSVTIFIKGELNEISQDPTTGYRTLTQVPQHSPPLQIEFNLTNSHPRHIRYLLRNHLNSLRWLSGNLAPRISKAATDIGSGGFNIRVFVTLTCMNVVVTSPLSEEESRQEILKKLVLGGKIEGEDLNDIDRENESCPICLENFLAGSNFTYPTRMSCSHVFHEACLLDWLERENTCPICRTVLPEQ